jgi:hypothetical protein
MSSEQSVLRFRSFEETVRRIKQIDANALNQRILAQQRSQIITPEQWNLRVTI